MDQMNLCRTCQRILYRTRKYLLPSGQSFYYSTLPSAPSTKKYQDSLLLPKTDFPLRIPAERRKNHESELAQRLKFEQLYTLQRSWRRDQPEFILHDGPPYANGEPHVGHAVNKILKDITNRYKLLRGFRINYTPGWDCHGLPIELKTMKGQLKGKATITTPVQLREAARKVANESIEKQKQMFKRWNIMAEWNNCYHTFDKNYIKSQLQLFYSLYEKGFVYRALKPVFWSPSSQSALAEAELEYKSNHESLAVFLTLNLNQNLQEFLSTIECTLKEDLITNPEILTRPVETIIWTTTPWSIPANKAVCYNEREKYSIVFKANSYPSDRVFYVIASDQVPLVSATVGAEYRILCEFSGSKLSNATYLHPWFENLKCPFLHGDHVLMDKGTGLVHTAPAHGNEDYVIGLKHKLPVDCYIDDKGDFVSTLESVGGLHAMTAGNAAVVKKLESRIIHKEKYNHSYPYDWRTKKPILIKTSLQWFIDTEKLKQLAADELKNVSIYPKNVQNGMLNQIMTRPFWCISRQRVWGVPMPVLYSEATGEPLVDKVTIDKMCDLVDEHGNIDWWWTISPSDLAQNKENQSFTKGKDIFDIWLDSGISWHILNGNVADLYLEGYDQFTGWFQSSLLTSIALRGVSPYKNLFVHGFVVDANDAKMSKSEGNVINPASITDGDTESNNKALGVDVLRWWVASQGSANADNITMSTSFLRSADESVQKLRGVLRFLVSFASEEVIETLDIDEVSYEELMYTDQYMLSLLSEFQKSITNEYENFRYHRAIMKILHFATTEVSANYFTWVKDRLYCDLEDSQSRKSAIFVLNQIYNTLVKALAPAIPFLAEESFTHYSSVPESLFKYSWFNIGEKTWENSNITEMFDLVLDVRTNVNQIIGANNRKGIWVEIICNQKNYKILQVLHSDKANSELCDLLQVSGVDLQCSDQTTFAITPYGVSHSLNGFSVAVSKSDLMMCARCRRHCCLEGVAVCSRCQSVLKRIDQQTQQSLLEEQPKDIVRGRT